MARKRVVSSTVTEYVVPCQFFSLESMKLVEKLVSFGADFDPSKAEKLVRERYDSDTLKLVLVGKAEPRSKFYELSEAVYIARATRVRRVEENENIADVETEETEI